MNALEKAGLSPSDAEFETAVAVVGLMGPLGEERTLRLIKNAMENHIITGEQATAFLLSDIGNALAHYFGVQPYVFKLNVTRAGITGSGQAKRKEILYGWNNFMSWLKN